MAPPGQCQSRCHQVDDEEGVKDPIILKDHPKHVNEFQVAVFFSIRLELDRGVKDDAPKGTFVWERGGRFLSGFDYPSWC